MDETPLWKDLAWLLKIAAIWIGLILGVCFFAAPIKFTAEGKVVVQVETSNADANGGEPVFLTDGTPVGRSLERVLLILSRGMVVPVLHKERFQGLITKIDVLNHMRLHGFEMA